VRGFRKAPASPTFADAPDLRLHPDVSPPRKTVEQLLDEARAGLDRVDPRQAHEALRDGALLIDIRSDSQRERDGLIPGARFIARNVFEWRCDPSSDWNDGEVVEDTDRRVIVFCNEGYQSSLAAATLKQFGFANAADLIGGFQAWAAAGLQVDPGPRTR
jgi:rhodanese-related sulfurtransferase